MDAKRIFGLATLLSFTNSVANAAAEYGETCGTYEDCASDCCISTICTPEKSCEALDGFGAIVWVFIIGGACCGILCTALIIWAICKAVSSNRANNELVHMQ